MAEVESKAPGAQNGASGSKAASREASVAAAASGANNPKAKDANAFRDQDFISFDLLGPEPSAKANGADSQRGQGSRRGKGKGKQRQLDSDREDDKDGATDGGRGDSRRQGDRDRPGKKSLKRKRQEEARTAQTDRGTPWAEEVDWASCPNAAAALHREIAAFDRYIEPTPEEHDLRKMVIEIVRRAVVGRFKDAQVHAFGSQETQLYLPQGDIDLVCISQEMARLPDKKCLRTLANTLRANKIANEIAVIQAKVPIVKFTTIPSLGSFKVDLSINRTNGIAAAKFVNEWLDRQPALRPMVMCIKCLLSQRGMAEVFSGGLGSFSVILMTISFLQLHPKLQRREIDPCENLGVLLLEFLELYGKNFGYDNVAITVREDGGYFSKPRNGWKDERKPFLLSIEDPLDSSNDISKGSWNILEVRTLFASTFDILNSACCKRAMEMRRDPSLRSLMPRNTHKRYGGNEDEEARQALINGARGGDPAGALEKDPRSLLGHVLGTSRSVQRSRAELLRLYQSGSVQRRLKRSLPGAPPQPGPSSSSLKAREQAQVRDAVRAEKEAGAEAAQDSAGSLSLLAKGVVDDEADGGDASASAVDGTEPAEGQGFFFDTGAAEDGAADEDDADSKYAAARPSRKKRRVESKSATRAGSGTEKAFVPGSDSSGSEDNDMSLPTLVGQTPSGSAISSPRGRGKVSAQDRRDFWASKTTRMSGQQDPDSGDESGYPDRDAGSEAGELLD